MIKQVVVAKTKRLDVKRILLLVATLGVLAVTTADQQHNTNH